MKVAIRIAIGILLCMSWHMAFPQDAKVIALSDKDAAQIKALYAQRDELNKKIDAALNDIRKNYLIVLEGDKDAGNYSVPESFDYDSLATISSGSISLCSAYDSYEEDKDTHYLRVIHHDCPTPPNTPPEKEDRPLPKMHYYRSGWGSGDFLFSTDYKYIVPKPTPPYNPNQWGGNCITLTGSSPILTN